jgi:SAM-dependent methyltransferase
LLLPLAIHLVPTAIIGYGVVLPAACIAPLGTVGVGFALSLFSTVLAYVSGVRMALNAAHPADWIAAVLSRQAVAPHGVLGHLLGRLWVTETAAVNATALDLLAPQAHEHVLEIGFGPGRTLQRIAQRAAQVTGIDVSDTMLAAARRRNARAIRDGRVELLRGNGITLPLPERTIDAALAVHTVYFWPDPERTLTEVARVLRPGGRVVLAFRDANLPAPRRFDRRIYRLYRAEDVARMLTRLGFADIKIRRSEDASDSVVWVRASSPD